MSKTIEAQAIEASIKAVPSPMDIKSKVDELLAQQRKVVAEKQVIVLTKEDKSLSDFGSWTNHKPWQELTKEMAEKLIEDGLLFRATEDFLIDRLSL